MAICKSEKNFQVLKSDWFRERIRQPGGIAEASSFQVFLLFVNLRKVWFCTILSFKWALSMSTN